MLNAIISIIFICYCLTLRKALVLAGEKNRTMSPKLVWLNLIPIFSFGWHFYTVVKISKSIGNWHEEQEKEDSNKGARTLGLITSILFCGGPIILIFIGKIGEIILILGTIAWIMYWVKIAGYNRKMGSSLQTNIARKLE